MITTDVNGEIVVEANGASYSLNSQASYMEMLLWLTSPDPATVIDLSAFEIDPDAPEESKETLERYSGFLKRFAQKREATIHDASTKDFSQREREIDALLERLAKE